MIQFILVQNRQGITRLSKYYRQYNDDERVRLEDEIHRLETGRDAKFTNFVEVRRARRGRRRPCPGPAVECVPSPSAPLTRCARRRTSAPSPARAPARRAVQAVQARLPEIRRPLLHAVRRVQRQRAGHVRVDPSARRGARSVLRQRLRARSCLQLLQGEGDRALLVCAVGWRARARSRALTARVRVCSQVYMILDELFLAGEVQETSKRVILERVRKLDVLD